MKKAVYSFLILFIVTDITAQSITTKLSSAYNDFISDPQLRNAIASICVMDASTGKIIFERNSSVGLAPASTQKIITAAAAYDLLGADFRFETDFGYFGNINGNGELKGGLIVRGSGDPTLGSWRWKHTGEDDVLKRFLMAFRSTGIRELGSLWIDNRGWESEDIPGGWVWDDIGNYYGAGAGVLNWRENQYDLFLKSGNDTGSQIQVVGTQPFLYNYKIISKATAAPKGTGDNAYIYFPVSSSEAVVRGTIPVGESRFVISGAMPSGSMQLLNTISDSLLRNGILKQIRIETIDRFSGSDPGRINIFHKETSPGLDSISYWFLRRSINLYGEALIKTMAYRMNMTATAANGARLVRDHWSQKGIGINKTELNLHDGSGLSPHNRTTTHAQVAILHYARKQAWFEGYYKGFPEYNGMKMKSGTISGVKGFCGYHRAGNGKEYIFSILVNNYNGSASSVVQKMYRVLNVLK